MPVTRLPTFNVKSKNIGGFIMKRKLLALLMLLGTFAFISAQKVVRTVYINYVDYGAERSIPKLLGADKYLVDSLIVTGKMFSSNYLEVIDLCNNGRLRGLNLENCGLSTSEYGFWNITVPDNAFFPPKVNADEGYRTKLHYITLPATIDVIGENAFAFTDLCCIVIPKTIRVIKDGAFSNCTSLKEVTIKNPNANVKVSEGVFTGIDGSSELVVPEGGKAKYEASGLYKNFKSIRESAGLFVTKAVHVENRNMGAVLGSDKLEIDSLIVTGHVAHSDFIFLKRCIREGKLSGIDFSGCTFEDDEIPDEALGYGHTLNYLSLPENIKEIGDNAFFDNYFYEFHMPQSVRKLGWRSFSGTFFGDVDIRIPEGVKIIPEDCFSVTSFGKNLYLPSTLEKVEHGGLALFKHINCDLLSKCVYINRKTPPVSGERTLGNNSDYDAGLSTLYVPIGAKAAYEADAVWSCFKEIIETSELTGTSGIKDAVQDVEADGLVEVYTTDGRQVHKGKDMPHLGKGMYVVKENGKARKVVVNK